MVIPICSLVGMWNPTAFSLQLTFGLCMKHASAFVLQVDMACAYEISKGDGSKKSIAADCDDSLDNEGSGTAQDVDDDADAMAGAERGAAGNCTGRPGEAKARSGPDAAVDTHGCRQVLAETLSVDGQTGLDITENIDPEDPPDRKPRSAHDCVACNATHESLTVRRVHGGSASAAASTSLILQRYHCPAQVMHAVGCGDSRKGWPGLKASSSAHITGNESTELPICSG